jgi:type II secretory pathway component GspD/PulD (secretin)
VVDEMAVSPQTTSPIPLSMIRLLSAAVLAAAVAGAAAWQIAPRGSAVPEPNSAPATEQPRITLRARNVEVGDVLRSVAAQAGAAPSIDPHLVGKLSLETQGTPLSALMSDLCTAFSCTWEVVRQPRRTLVVRMSAPPRPEVAKPTT